MTLESLEARRLLAIVPGQLYQEVEFQDANGDTVEVKVNGLTGDGQGFLVQLSGDATNGADVHSLHLVGLTAENGLSIVVTPNELTINAGAEFGKLYSSGYTNVALITADAGVTELGGIHLSGVIVNHIALPNTALAGITLDTGMTVFADTVNTAALNSINVSAPTITVTNPITGEAEIYDESPTGPTSGYNPSAGLIDLWDVTAASIGSIVVNGIISADTKDPFDETKLTNDLRGVITVTGEIGSIVAPRSAMRNAIRAGGIGMVRLGQIDGEITTSDALTAMTLYVPKQFSGFLNAAGHLNIGFTGASGELVTANIQAGGGISGSDASLTDPILVPDKFAAPVYNTSTAVGIAGIQVNGAAMARWYSASSIGDVSARSFDPGSLFEAATDIGDVEMLMTTQAGTSATGASAQVAVVLDGFFQAGGSIGNVKSATGIKAQLIAGVDIGNITGVTGGLSSTVVLAGGSIGDITVFQTAPSTTEIKAGGDIGDILLYSGDLSWNIKADGSIGKITLEAGAITKAVIVAGEDLCDITVTSPTLTAIEGGSLIAGGDIGTVTAYAFGQTAILGVLIQAGNRIDGVTGISYGSTTLPAVAAGIPSSVADDFNGIDKAQILAAEIGSIFGQAYVGTGLYRIVVHAQVGDIDSITGIGNGDGIYTSIVVAEGGIGPIQGLSTVLGSGIEAGSFDANGKFAASNGTIGQITAQGGPAGGHGVHLTRFQASNRIEGIDAVANANGGDAVNTITAYGVSYGTISALVLGGQTGNGIVDSTFRAWTDYQNDRPDVQVDAVRVDVRSGLGVGISGSTFQVKGSLTDLEVKAFNGSAIYNSRFTVSQGDFGRIYAETINGGTAIDLSTFIASNGSITLAEALNDVLSSGLTAISGGTAATDHAIARSSFSADKNLGVVYAYTKGGAAISESTFIADSDYGNANNGPNLPDTILDPDDQGAIFGVYARTSGQNWQASAGITESSFEAEKFGFITAEVIDREEGGAGISKSIFNARNAVYDGAGNFDNQGTIGPITVLNGSLRGNGIEYSRFYAGTGGSIGDINVRVLGGTGISTSEFWATMFDFDQNLFTGTIGKITVSAGRSGNGGFLPVPPPPNDAWTLLPAGIDSSIFAADAGIGDVTVTSIGTGVFNSLFLADYDALTEMAGISYSIIPQLGDDTPGDLGNVTILNNGRFSAGAVYSLFSGSNVGDLMISVSSRDSSPAKFHRPGGPPQLRYIFNAVETLIGFNVPTETSPAASAASIYLASNGSIGLINVQNAGTGYDSLDSAYVALPSGFYGPVAAMDSASGNYYWETERPSATQLSEPSSIPANVPRTLPPATVEAVASQPETFAPLPAVPPTPVVIPTAPVDTTSPVVRDVSGIESSAARYTPGVVLSIRVTFSEPVQVHGSPTIPFSLGRLNRTFVYSSGSGTDTLVFQYIVTRADVQARGAATNARSITLPEGAMIVDFAGNAASLPTAPSTQPAASNPGRTPGVRLGAAHPRGAAPLRPQAVPINPQAALYRTPAGWARPAALQRQGFR